MKLGIVAHICNLSIRETEAGEFFKFQTNLGGRMRPYLKKQKKKKKPSKNTLASTQLISIACFPVFENLFFCKLQLLGLEIKLNSKSVCCSFGGVWFLAPMLNKLCWRLQLQRIGCLFSSGLWVPEHTWHIRHKKLHSFMFVCICACPPMHALVCGNQRSQLFLSTVWGPGNQTWVIRRFDKYLHLLSHLTSPVLNFLKV